MRKRQTEGSPQPRMRRQGGGGPDVQSFLRSLLRSARRALFLRLRGLKLVFLSQCRRSRGARITGGGSYGGYSVTGAWTFDSADHSRRKLVGRGRAWCFGSTSWRPMLGLRPVLGDKGR